MATLMAIPVPMLPPVAAMVISATTNTSREAPASWEFRTEFLSQLVRQVPTLLASQDPTTGRFGKGVWVVNDQHVLLPLAAAWAIDDPANPYHHDPKVLEAVMKGGDALIDAQNARGMWVFRKKDNSTWGDIYMPWTYSRWVRAFALIKDGMPPERRARWEKALTLGYEGISKGELARIHNIPAHHAMGLYVAGAALGRPEWQRQAAEFLRKVAGTQDPAGFWSENSGPVVGYNFVYVDALGVYYHLSHDPVVLPALERAARFHAAMTYPDGSAVETVDERQVYHKGVSMPNVGFTFSPEGRGYARQQWERLQSRQSNGNALIAPELAAAYLLYGDTGPAVAPPGAGDTGQTILGKNDALAARRSPWFVVLSAYTAPVPQSRWIQDRQNLVSLFHDRTGLILGGGNSKLTPLWSTFTLGDTSRLFHKPGDENPDFTPPSGLFHVPASTKLDPDGRAMSLTYGTGDAAVRCRVAVALGADDTARLTCSCDPADAARAGLPVAAHLQFLPRINGAWRTASGRSGTLNDMPLRLTGAEVGGWFEHNGWRVSLPPGASLVWPVLPHDQYRKDGHADTEQGHLVVSLPLTSQAPHQEVSVTIVKPHP